jgi:hypothetical protein
MTKDVAANEHVEAVRPEILSVKGVGFIIRFRKRLYNTSVSHARVSHLPFVSVVS